MSDTNFEEAIDRLYRSGIPRGRITDICILARIIAKEEIIAMGMKAAETDRREANLCTCGAAGSGEEHEEWCEAAALSGKGET